MVLSVTRVKLLAAAMDRAWTARSAANMGERTWALTAALGGLGQGFLPLGVKRRLRDRAGILLTDIAPGRAASLLFRIPFHLPTCVSPPVPTHGWHS